MPGMRSSAATKCISDVPGLLKQVFDPAGQQGMHEALGTVHGRPRVDQPMLPLAPPLGNQPGPA